MSLMAWSDDPSSQTSSFASFVAVASPVELLVVVAAASFA